MLPKGVPEVLKGMPAIINSIAVALEGGLGIP